MNHALRCGVLVSLVFLSSLATTAEDAAVPDAVLTIPYTWFEGRVASLSIEDFPKGPMSIQVSFGEEIPSEELQGRTREFLTQEVARLASGGDVVQLGETDILFHYIGGHLLQTPFRLVGKYSFTLGLTFARVHSIEGARIEAVGSEKEPIISIYPTDER